MVNLIARVTVLTLLFSSMGWAQDYSATAGIVSDSKARYRVEGKANRLVAANAAQAACLAANPEQNATKGFCELTKMGGQRVTTSLDIRARLPQERHPLFLWQYESEQATVYLAGSVHILKPGLYPLPEQYDAAFKQADNLVLEVDLSKYSADQLQNKSAQYAFLADQQQLSDVLPEAVFNELVSVTNEYGLPLNQLAGFKPSFITQQLVVLALISAGYDPSQGVESYFTQQANHKNILELETLDFQLDLLMNQDMVVQIEMAKDTIEQMDNFQTLTADLITAWLSGDDAEFLRAFNAQSGDSPESQAFMRQLMDERNVSMAQKVKGYLKQKGTFFVLIGAAHFIGAQSIIAHLNAAGITGTRIYSNDTL